MVAGRQGCDDIRLLIAPLTAHTDEKHRCRPYRATPIGMPPDLVRVEVCNDRREWLTQRPAAVMCPRPLVQRRRIWLDCIALRYVVMHDDLPVVRAAVVPYFRSNE